MYQDVLQTILDTKIIAILRGVAPDQLTPLAEVLYQGGIRCIEVTFDQKRADGVRATADAIARLSGAMRGRMYIGSGTVLTVEQAEATAAAGGTFVISPNCNQMVIRRTRELEMVSIPGAMTPTEIVQAAAYCGPGRWRGFFWRCADLRATRRIHPAGGHRICRRRLLLKALHRI